MRKLYYTLVIFLPLVILYACFHKKYLEKTSHPQKISRGEEKKKEIPPREKPLAVRKMEEEKQPHPQPQPKVPPDEKIDCMAYEKSNYPVRPEAKNGTFYVEGKPIFLIGPWLPYRYNDDGNAPIPIKEYQNIPAYNKFFDYDIAMEYGFTTCHPPLPTWFVCKKLFPECPRLNMPDLIDRKNYYPKSIQNLKSLPLVCDFATIKGYDVLDQYQLPDPTVYQQNKRWHTFVPYCPEHPLGMKIYKTYWRDGACRFLKNRGNAWIYELFNEPAYDCRCEYNKANFVKYLENRYGTIEKANKKWGNNFKSFKETIKDPVFERQKGLWVDWSKFIEERWCEVLKEGMETIREVDKREKVYFSSQHNTALQFLTTENGYDEYKCARVLDVINTEGGIHFGKRLKSDDPMETHQLGKMRLYLDICRAAAEGKPIIDTEQDTRRFDENHMRISSKRGDLSLMLWNEVIHGGSSVQIYAWCKRAFDWPTKDLAGAEAFVHMPNTNYAHAHLLNPFCYPGDTIKGIKDAKEEIEKLAEIVLPQPRIKGEVALLLSSASRRYARSIEKNFTTYYEALESSHYPFDVIFEEQVNKGWAGKYKAIISPYCHYTYDDTVGDLRKYVNDGGILISQGMDLSFDEYGKAENNNKLLGLASRTPLSMTIPDEISLTIPTEEGYPEKIKSELCIKVEVDGAKVLSESRKNIPQITYNSVGKGKVYYNACKTEGLYLGSILTALLKDAGIEQPFTLSTRENKLLPQVESQVIDRGDTKLYYFVNWERMSELGEIRLCNPSSGWSLFPKEYYLSDPVTNALYLNPDGEESWTNAQLNKGVTIFLPGEERVLLLLTKTKPEWVKTSKSLKDVEKEYKARKTEDDKEGKALEEKIEKEKQAYIQRNKYLDAVEENCFPIHISKHCNMGFEDDVAGDGKGGGFDHGGNNDLREFPAGKQEFCNIPFSIVNPAKNHGKSIIVLRGHDQDCFPLEVKGIPVNRKLKRLYFLHTIAWNGGKFTYIVNYDDGSNKEIEIRAGKEIGDWWDISESKAPLAKIAWTGKNNLCKNIGVYCCKWENPEKNKIIKTLDIKSFNSGMVPAIIAITGEKKEIPQRKKPLAVKKTEEEKQPQPQPQPEVAPDGKIDCMAHEKSNYLARPEAKNGTFYVGDKPVFLIGTWLPYRYNDDGNAPIPIKEYQNIPAYNKYFDYDIAMQYGFTTCHPPLPTWFVCKKLFPECPRLNIPELVDRKNYYPKSIQNLKNLPLVCDFATIKGYDVLDQYQLPDPTVYQQNKRWHTFVPYCPEHPLGMKIYKTYWRDGACRFLKNGNAWIYELFNEPAYDCRCEYNKAGFVKYLENRYRTIEKANKKWGSNFKSFKETIKNPVFENQEGLWVDWSKFIEDRWCEVLKEGMRTIREVDKREKIYFSSQHNMSRTFLTTLFAGYDEYKCARVLDVINTEGGCPFGKRLKSDDPMEEHHLGKIRLSLDCCRAAAEGKPVIDTEQDTRRFDENHKRISSKRGDLTLMLWDEVIHGSSSVQIYAWCKRAFDWPTKDLAGAAVFSNVNYAQAHLLNPFCYPGDTLKGIKDAKEEIEKLAEIVLPQPRIKGDVALLLSTPSKRYVRNIEKNFTTYYEALESSHYPFDVIFEEQVNKGWAKNYKAIISPYCHYTYDDTVENLRKYAEDGGVVILQGMDLSFDEYGKAENNNKFLGLASRTPISPTIPDEISMTIPTVEGYPEKIKCELCVKVEVDSAKVLSESQKNIPQITRNSVGKGKVYHIGCKTEKIYLSSMITALLKDAEIEQPFTLWTRENKLLPQVEAQVIDRGDTKFYYFANWDRASELGVLKLCKVPAGQYYLTNPVADCTYVNPEGKETWTNVQLSEGVKVFLPGEERVLLLLTKTKPEWIKTSNSLQDVEKEYKARRTEDDKEGKALEERAEKAKQAYIQRNKYLDAVKENCFPIDISKHCNMGFKDDVAGDGKGGGFDHGPNNDLREFPVGKEEFCNILFSIIDPAKNNRKSIIVLRGHGQDCFPLEVKGIPVNRKLKRLYFLHTIAWNGGNFAYIVNYDDGTCAEVPIRGGNEVGGWWDICESKAPAAKIAWTGKNDACKNIGVYCYRWENPQKNKIIKNLNIKSYNWEMIPAIIAITGEE